MHGHLDAIDAGVGEFVAVASGAMELYIIIARDRSEQNFVGGGVDGSEHVDIATATLHVGHVAIGIDAADENSEWFGGYINVDIAYGICGVNANFNSI